MSIFEDFKQSAADKRRTQGFQRVSGNLDKFRSKGLGAVKRRAALGKVGSTLLGPYGQTALGALELARMMGAFGPGEEFLQDFSQTAGTMAPVGMLRMAEGQADTAGAYEQFGNMRGGLADTSAARDRDHVMELVAGKERTLASLAKSQQVTMADVLMRKGYL